MSNTLETVQELDCRGLGCPLPIIKTKQAIDKMEVGQMLKMMATDPGSVNDMAAWVSKTGHELVDSARDGDVFSYFIRKIK